MKPKHLAPTCAALLPLLAIALGDARAAGGADRSAEAGAQTSTSDLGATAVAEAGAPARRAFLTDDDVEPYRVRLLRVAFEGVSEMPMEPHVKTRSSLQESLIRAMLELGQRRTAAETLPRIQNWRRGLSQAALARACVDAGAGRADVEPFLKSAQVVADGGEELKQAWRKDRILSEIGSTWVALGDAEKALEVERAVSADSESGKVELARAERGDTDDCDRLIASFDAVLERGTLDHVRNTLNAALAYYERFYDDEVRRGLLETKVQAAVHKVPRVIGVDVMRELARITHEHGAHERALEAMDEAEALCEGIEWMPGDRIKLMARLATTRAAIGETEAARAQADEALEVFEAEREQIMDGWRGESLREVAEAYVAMGARDAALETYRTCFLEGGLNVNARPRAMDLAANCISMAVQGVEPDEALWERIEGVRAGLQDPW